MKADDSRSLLARHLLGALKPEETDRLMRRALQDQALFDELLTIEDARQAFEDPTFRTRIATDLRAFVAAQKRSRVEWPWRGRVRSVWMGAGALAVAAMVLLVVRPGADRGGADLKIDLGSGQGPMMHATELAAPRLQEPPKLESPADSLLPEKNQASFAFDRPEKIPVYREGDEMRIGFQLASNAPVVVIEERSDGTSLRLFPNRFQSSPDVTAQTLTLIPPTGQGPLAVEGPAGIRTVRLMIFPVGTDPLDFRTPWETTRRNARILTRQYRVVGQR